MCDYTIVIENNYLYIEDVYIVSMGRVQYSKRDIKELIKNLPLAEKFIEKKSQVVQDDIFLLVNNKILFFKDGNRWIPTLHVLLGDVDLLPKVVVDKGAIRFVVNGADIMRPGIVSCAEFASDEYVVIVDETYGKPLGVGLAMKSSSDIMALDGGKVVKAVHFVGDDVWERGK